MALSITTIGVTAGDGDREPAHTGAISIFMDNHEPVARASRVGRTAKVSGVDNTETGRYLLKRYFKEHNAGVASVQPLKNHLNLNINV